MKGKPRAVTAVVAALVASLAAAFCGAAAAASELMPGVTYERLERIVRGKEVIVHVVTAPRPGSLYRLVPVLSNGTIAGTETVTPDAGCACRAPRPASPSTATSSAGSGRTPPASSLRDGALHGRPTSSRSSLGIGLDGLLRIAQISFFGTWSVGEDAANGAQPAEPAARGLAGRSLHAGLGRRDAQAAGCGGRRRLGAAADQRERRPRRRRSRRSGAGEAPRFPRAARFCRRTGARAAGLQALALPGAPFVVKLILKPWWEQVADAIGGGPALVREGRIALPTSEGVQLVPASERGIRERPLDSAADGRILLVAVDGRSSRSAGMTMRDLAVELRRLNAVTAYALDGGGSTTLAFDGDVLNVPSDGSERPVSDALMVMYFGAYAAIPSAPVVSPNGDGAAEGQRLAYKLVRPSTVDVRLVGPGGGVLWHDEGAREPGHVSARAGSRGQARGPLALGRARDRRGRQRERSRARRSLSTTPSASSISPPSG